MTEEEARAWLRDRFGVSRETSVATFLDLVLAESARQNLISRGSIDSIWLRHVVDSAQLLDMVPEDAAGLWVDIGTGAGFPGMIVALLTDRDVALVEPRRKRADFLAEAVASLDIGARVTVYPSRIEHVRAEAAVISARAVAALPELLAMAHSLSTEKTCWLLPKGVNAREEVAAARQTWHGRFHVEQSITQAGSLIIVATGVAPR